MKVFSPAALPALASVEPRRAGFGLSEPAASPPAFVRAAVVGGGSTYLVSHVIEMLGRGPQRAHALIQTLATHGPAHVLGAALRAKPSLLDPSMLLALARSGSFKEFEAALTLRPGLIDEELVAALGAETPDARSTAKCLAAVFRLRPDLLGACAVNVDPRGRTEPADGPARPR